MEYDFRRLYHDERCSFTKKRRFFDAVSGTGKYQAPALLG
jgi:hypothetical protein